jgi:hypothetical protein
MKKSEFFNIGLPKWPALAVVGKPVTPEQAMEILIRTDHLYFSSNDHEFDKRLNEILYEIEIPYGGYDTASDAICQKLGIDKDDLPLKWTKVDEYKQKFLKGVGHISLSYLNNSQIVSSWIGGPHGWCNWNGDIGSRNYNIGKWPSVQEVYEDWKKIAAAFPVLDLKCQLMGHEAGPEDGEDKPLIEFIVRDGKVRMSVPKKPLTQTAFGSADMFARFNNPHAERGCTIELFKQAVEHTHRSVNKEAYEILGC